MSERAGKDLLLKFGSVKSVASTASSSSLTITAHGMSVGDILVFTGAVGSNTTIDADTPYYVKSVEDANTVTIAETPSGSAIVLDDTEAAMAAVGYSTIGGLRSHSLSFSADGIDGTNYGSNQWQTFLDGAGIRSMSVSGDGVYTSDTVFRAMEDAALANTLAKLAWVDVSVGVVYLGSFKISSLENGGAHDGEGTYSMSADSSGAVTVTRAA